MGRTDGLAMGTVDDLRIAPATEQDVPLVLRLIHALAEYEQLAGEVLATEETLRASLFGPRPMAEVAIAWVGDEAAGFAVFFHNYSTFVGRPGLYLEDLFVLPAWRRQGIGRALLAHLAAIALARGCGRMEWAVIDWNALAIRVYRSVGAVPMQDWTIYRLSGRSLGELADEATAPPGATR